jgi:hypothetical protein
MTTKTLFQANGQIQEIDTYCTVQHDFADSLHALRLFLWRSAGTLRSPSLPHTRPPSRAPSRSAPPCRVRHQCNLVHKCTFRMRTPRGPSTLRRQRGICRRLCLQSNSKDKDNLKIKTRLMLLCRRNKRFNNLNMPEQIYS